MNNKVLILGSTGMLGHQVYFYLKNKNYELSDFSFRNKLQDRTIIVDVKNKVELESKILKLKPSFIINCIGVLIKGSNNNLENAIYINAYLPHHLKNIADEVGAKLIHISTDCVFSGNKGNYRETDEKDGYDYYAKTKALGEIDCEKHLTLRTSIVGPELKKTGEGLFHWFMNQKENIEGYQGSLWSGVTTLELAKAIEWGIKSKVSGIYHITNGKAISKFDLLELIRMETGKEISIKPVLGKCINKTLIDTRKCIDYKIPEYHYMIKEMVEMMRRMPEIYGQYKI